MIQEGTKLKVTDNSGAKIVKCIKVLGGSQRRWARIGDVITVAVQEATPRQEVGQGDVQKAVVTRQKKPLRRSNGTYISFDENACVLIDGVKPIGNHIFGPIPRELRERFPGIISQAEEVL